MKTCSIIFFIGSLNQGNSRIRFDNLNTSIDTMKLVLMPNVEWIKCFIYPLSAFGLLNSNVSERFRIVATSGLHCWLLVASLVKLLKYNRIIEKYLYHLCSIFLKLSVYYNCNLATRWYIYQCIYCNIGYYVLLYVK